MATDTTDAEFAARELDGQAVEAQRSSDYATAAVLTVGAEIVRALGRIERELRELRESQGICGHGATGICMNCLAQALNR